MRRSDPPPTAHGLRQRRTDARPTDKRCFLGWVGPTTKKDGRRSHTAKSESRAQCHEHPQVLRGMIRPLCPTTNGAQNRSLHVLDHKTRGQKHNGRGWGAMRQKDQGAEQGGVCPLWDNLKHNGGVIPAPPTLQCCGCSEGPLMPIAVGAGRLLLPLPPGMPFVTCVIRCGMKCTRAVQPSETHSGPWASATVH